MYCGCTLHDEGVRFKNFLNSNLIFSKLSGSFVSYSLIIVKVRNQQQPLRKFFFQNAGITLYFKFKFKFFSKRNMIGS